MASHAASFRRLLKTGDTILICDVGGGTTDFTLIRARFENDELRFERTAIGEHLLLGGDNLDLALAKRIEARLGGARLTLRQQQALARLASAAKEQLLGERPTASPLRCRRPAARSSAADSPRI
jgi:molecular chaperone DnaK (HSP70)